MKTIDLDMTRDVMGAMTLQVEVRVIGVRMGKLRFWLGTRILRLAARVIGCNIEITEAK